MTDQLSNATASNPTSKAWVLAGSACYPARTRRRSSRAGASYQTESQKMGQGDASMTPLEIFQHLPEQDPLSDRAWEELTILARAKGRSIRSCRPALMEEFVQELLLQIHRDITLSRGPVFAADGQVVLYVKKSLHRRFLQHLRKEPQDKVVPALPEGDESPPDDDLDGASTYDGDAEKDAGAMFKAMDLLLDHGFALSPASDWVGRRIAWEQLKLLALEPIDSRQALERTGRLPSGASEDQFTAARDAMYTAHKRVLKQLEEAARNLEERGRPFGFAGAPLAVREVSIWAVLDLLKRRATKAGGQSARTRKAAVYLDAGAKSRGSKAATSGGELNDVHDE